MSNATTTTAGTDTMEAWYRTFLAWGVASDAYLSMLATEPHGPRRNDRLDGAQAIVQVFAAAETAAFEAHQRAATNA